MDDGWVAYASAVASGLVVTVAGGAALASGDPAVVAGVLAATLAVLAWTTAQLSEDTEAGIGVADVAWGVALAVRGRTSPGRLLPLAAAQVVGAGAGGLLLAVVGGRWADPHGAAPTALGAAALVGLVVGVIGGVAAVLADLHAADAGAGLAGLAGAALPGTLAVAVHPPALLGLALAGSVGWPAAGVTAVTVLAGHVLAGLWGRVVAPS